MDVSNLNRDSSGLIDQPVINFFILKLKSLDDHILSNIDKTSQVAPKKIAQNSLQEAKNKSIQYTGQ